MRIIYKQPGQEIDFIRIQGTLKDLQKLVDGPIEVGMKGSNWVIICNEEGLLRGMEFNCMVDGVPFVGPIVLVGIDGEDFTDMPMSPEFWN